jgi:hypothetical protein
MMMLLHLAGRILANPRPVNPVTIAWFGTFNSKARGVIAMVRAVSESPFRLHPQEH